MRGREGFRLVHYSVQSNHLHLICEALDRSSLARGLQSLAIRIAKRLNSLWQRIGRVFADRYHARILRSPREVRNALAYVLDNAARHGVPIVSGRADPFSSGRWLHDWRDGARASIWPRTPVAVARTWLLSVGWKLSGAITFS